MLGSVPTMEPEGLADAAAEAAAEAVASALLEELLEQPARTAMPRAPTAAMARAVVVERFMVMPFMDGQLRMFLPASRRAKPVRRA